MEYPRTLCRSNGTGLHRLRLLFIVLLIYQYMTNDRIQAKTADTSSSSDTPTGMMRSEGISRVPQRIWLGAIGASFISFFNHRKSELNITSLSTSTQSSLISHVGGERHWDGCFLGHSGCGVHQGYRASSRAPPISARRIFFAWLWLARNGRNRRRL